jgi:signal peptidase I
MDLKEFQIKEPNKIKEAWNWLWKSDSWLSWLVSLLIAFIIVKFIFFPLLSLVFSTSLPLVVIESSSMHHQGFIGNWFKTKGSFDNWWNQYHSWYEKNNISQSEAEKFSFRTGLEKGNIIIVWGRGELKLGDIIIFNAGQQYPIIHRIIKIENINNTLYYSTKGDNNNLAGREQFQFESGIKKEQILGKAVFRIPLLGWVKLAFVEIIRFIIGIFKV